MSMEETAKRRPFFSTPEELYDEEYLDEQSPEKKRRLTPEQVDWFEILIYFSSKFGMVFLLLIRILLSRI